MNETDELDELIADSMIESGMDMGNVEVTPELIRKALLNIPGFFQQFFIPDEMELDVPQVHNDIWDRLTDQDKVKVLLAIPRGHAKTTLAKLCVVYYFMFTSYRFCLYVSNTNATAKNCCRDIVGYFDSDNYKQVFGPISSIKASETESLWIFEIILPNGEPKRCMLRALGAAQSVRGINVDNIRPDIMVVDDLEDDDNTSSEVLQKKLDRWVFGPLLKAMNKRRRKVLWLGNMLADTSLLARLSRKPAWNPVVFGSIIVNSSGNLAPLWPELYSLEELIEEFKEYASEGLAETWMCEMMNMPGFGRNGFSADALNLVPAPTPDDLRAAFLTLDPAFGLKEINDESAIAVHGIRHDGLPVTCTVVHGHFSEAEIFQHMLRLAYEWGAWVWGIESVAAQKVLTTLFETYAAQERLNHDIVFVPLKAGRGDPKISRIRSWVSSNASKSVGIADDLFSVANQLVGIDLARKDNKDDIVDSVAYINQMLEEFRELIESAIRDEPETQQVQYGAEICNV